MTYFSEIKLDKCYKILKSYSGHTLTPVGKINVEICLNDQLPFLDLYVVPREGSSLFGRDWLANLKLDWVEIKPLDTSPSSDSDVKLRNIGIKFYF